MIQSQWQTTTPAIAHLSAFFEVLSSPTRLRILLYLARPQLQRNVKSMCKALDLPQHLVSQHLRRLRMHGLVSFRQKGARRFYCASETAVPDDSGVTISFQSHTIRIANLD